MHLPELGLQFIYGRLAWGILLAAIIVALWPRRLVLSRAVIAAVVLAATALQALPGEASPAYWLGLAWQAPSALLVGLSLVSLYRGSGSAQNSAVMSPALALWLAAAGTILYVDAMGLTAIGWYYWGFGPYAAPVMALLLAGASALALVRGQARPQACALLLALMGFALLRLPTGNLWDALLDPLLWGWALLSVARLGWTRKQQAMPTRPARLNG
jgi:hypothetical protein